MNDSHNIDFSALLNVEGIAGIEEENPIEPIQLPTVVSNPEERNKDLSADYCSVREMLYFQQTMLMEAAKVSLDNARGSDSARSMEVFATLMNSMTVTNKELLKIHADMKKITDENVKSGQGNSTQNIENQNIFVGTPSELMGVVGSQYDAKKAAAQSVVIEHEKE